MNRMVDEHSGIAPWDERGCFDTEELLGTYDEESILRGIGADNVASWLSHLRGYEVFEYGGDREELLWQMAWMLRKAGWTVTEPAESDQKDSGKIITPVKSETASAEKRPKGQNDEAA